MSEKKNRNAYGIDQFYSKKFKTLPFADEWIDFCGCPEQKGSWFIYGNSSNGKTSFTAQLVKYLSNFGRVAYNSMEEGLSESLRIAFQIANITTDDNVLMIDKEPIAQFINRLRKPKSANFVVIDSFQYSGLNAASYKALTNEFSNKLFIIVSHAEGKNPAGRSAKTVHYDANVKVWVEGFKAFPKSRYGGGKPYVIWGEKAAEIWLD
jgi:hypothetical protein